MEIIFREHEGRFYPSYVLTILFIFKYEIVTKEKITAKKIGLDFTENSTILDGLVGFASAFFCVSEGFINKIFYYGYILIFLSRFKKPLGKITYRFNRSNVNDYTKGIINRAELLIISVVNDDSAL